MKCFRGTVKNNVVVLEEGAQLPEGTEVEIRVPVSHCNRDEAFRRVLARRIQHFVGIDAIIAEAKQEREERVGQWLP